MIYLKVIYTYGVRIDGVEVPFSDVFPVGLAPFVGKTFLSLQGCLRGSVKKKKKKINRQYMCGFIFGFSVSIDLCLFVRQYHTTYE